MCSMAIGICCSANSEQAAERISLRKDGPYTLRSGRIGAGGSR